MGSVDKLIKALEALKVFQSEAADESSLAARKKSDVVGTKEKINHCNTLADCICSPSVRAAAEFPNFVGIVVETLLSYANDKESDVRMVSDECLNRITRVLLDTNLGRLQVEFYKELKKNGPSRCIRSALWRFAELSPLIRPQKRRAFAVNLLPCIVKLAERHEEALQDCLMSAISNISSTLMSFAADSEVKAYLSPFINNLCSTSAVVRRVASTCASTIALHSRKPMQLFNWLLIQVLDMVLPIMHSTSAENLPIMLGCLHCIRLIIPLLEHEKVQTSVSVVSQHEHVIKLDTTVMLFELVVHCLQQPHPSTTTAALECYQQLLKTPTLPGFVDLVLTPGSISSSVLAVSYEATLAAQDTSTLNSQPELAISDTDSNPPLDELQVNLALHSDFLPSDPKVDASPGDMVDGEHRDSSAANSPSPTAEDTATVLSDSTPSQEGSKLPVELIGSLTDSIHPPVLYSARLLCQSFLLTGNLEERLYADREVRVSIKSLALSCLSYIIKLYPQCIVESLYTSGAADSNQPLADILLYNKHLDPQLQGMIAQVLGNLIHAGVHCQSTLTDTPHQDIESYIEMLLELLDNDNSMATRLTLSAVRTCVNSLLNSSYHDKGVQLLTKVFVHVNDSYWLVRVELLELLSEVDMLALIHVSGSRLQKAIVDDVVLRLLGDSDYRVRQSASSSLVKLIPQLFHGSDHPHQSVLLARATCQLSGLLYPFLSEFPIECPPLIHGLPPPFHPHGAQATTTATSAIIQSSLSKVILSLLEMFSKSSSQHTKLGAIHALYELSVSYPVTQYAHAWSCATGSSCVSRSNSSLGDKINSTTSSLKSLMLMDEFRLGSGGGPLTLIMSLLTHSSLSLDLSVHQDLLALAGSLLSGACLSALQQGQTTGGQHEKMWPGIYDRLLVPSAEKLLSHLIRLLNIYAHVLEETSLATTSNPKAVLDAAREAITSPLKKKAMGKQEQQATETSEPPKSAKEAEKAVKNKKETLGTFNHIPFYVKLHEAIKGAHLNYKVSLSLSKMDKFSNMVHQTLMVFSQLLEIASFHEIGKCAEEILEYLKSVVVASPVATVTIVHQMLKALFGTNLSSQYEDLVDRKVMSRSPDMMPTSSAVIKPGLFTSCLSAPYSELAQSLAHNPYRVETEDYHNPVYVIKRCEERKMPVVLRPDANIDKNTIGAYIRLFEPLVIKSLKMYTMSSSVQLQTQVLGLLVQLIQLRVNYCLLDNDEVFLGYVLKQVDMISEGPPSEQAGLIRCIFQLLLLLSYEKLHSKTLVVVPRIMQLCDGVIASGQNPLTHAIPALEMLVKDLFLCRSTNTTSNTDTAFHDIETQREVTASMLLRLIKHTKVLGLLTVVLYQLMRESEEKWKKLSRQVIDLLLPLISRQQIAVENREGMHALHNIFLAVSPSVYRPVDTLLKALFIQQTNLDSKQAQQRWMSSVLAILRVLLFIGKEDVILSRLNELEVTFDTSIMSSSSMSGQMNTSADSMISSSYGSVPPQELLASFLIQIIGFCTDILHSDLSCSFVSEESYHFSLQQFSLLLLYTSYMLQSGHFRKVTKFMMEQLHTDRSHLRHLILTINRRLEGAGSCHPTITLQWSYILMLLNYNDQSWWRRTLRTPSEEDECNRMAGSCLPVNQEITKRAGLAMYCDYVVENIHDAEHLTWLTVNHVNDIIDQLTETPVLDFMSAVYANSSASGLFISAIQSRYKMESSPSKLCNVVTCLRSMHKDQSGSVVMLLVEKMLQLGHCGISRQADSVACRRVEVLLAEDEETVHKQLAAEDILKLLVILQTNKLKHRRLLSLAEKLRVRFYPSVIPPSAFGDSSLASAPQTADKDFYLTIARLVCGRTESSPRLCASLLASLEMPDITAIMEEETFKVGCLSECIKHGTNKSVRADTGTVITANDGARVSQKLSPLFCASEQLLKNIWLKLRPAGSAEGLSASLEDSGIAKKAGPVSIDVVMAMCTYLSHTTPESLNSLDAVDLEVICEVASSYFEQVKVSGDILQSSHMMFSWTSHMEEITPDQAPADISQLCAHLVLLSHVLRCLPLNSVLVAQPDKVFTLIDSVTFILKSLAVPGLIPELENYKDVLAISQDGYIQASQLITCLSDVLLAGKSGLPLTLVDVFNDVIIGLARLPCVNEHARMPVSAFILSSETRGDNKKPQLRVDALQDTPVLREFIKRNNLLGWINRPQFEEAWAHLLHLLSPVAMTEVDHLAEEDDVENIEWMVSALRGITGLLCQTLNSKEPGNPLFTCYRHIARQQPIPQLTSTPIGRKLRQLRLFLDRKSVKKCQCLNQAEIFCNNIERVNCDIGYNQLSVKHLNSQLNKLTLPSLLMPSVEKADVELTEKSAGSGAVDTASCLKLLIDVYSHLLSPVARPRTPLMLLNECVKSAVMLSDLFYEKSQFEWMFTTLYTLYTHHCGEDELMNQYMLLGLCKAASMHSVESGAEEKVFKLVESALKSTHIPTRLAAIYGSLYILESATEPDSVKSLVNSLLDFVVKVMDSLSLKTLVLSELYSLSVWSLIFYLIEHFQEQAKSGPALISKVIQVGVQVINNCENNCTQTLCSAILSGFERLLLTSSISKQEGSILLKLASDRLSLPTMHTHLNSILGLLVTCMYSDLPDDEMEQTSMSEEKIELISTLFDRIRKGLPEEAEVITGILPALMSDLFTSQDIMNKVIGEFLSEQQPHSTLLARMVFEVFEQQAMATGGPALLHDWVLLSITSCTQRNPLAAAVWSLTCFFVSASSNHWLRGLFPFISTRIGMLEQVDETVFLLSCKDFYSSVANDSQRKQTLISVFQSAARNEEIYKSALGVMQ